MKNDSLVPSNREMSTGARALLVADILEEHPERHDQTTFVSGLAFEDFKRDWDPVKLAERRDCGTAACVAGWAVVCSPPALIRKAEKIPYISNGVHTETITWDTAGAKALGLEAGLADILFAEQNTRPRLIKALRVLANMDPKDRTLENAKKLNITHSWLEGNGRADKVQVPK